MHNLLKLLTFSLTLFIVFGCNKENQPDYRDKFTGDYIFTKLETTHYGGYVTETGSMGEPVEVWTSGTHDEILWESSGSVKTKYGSNKLVIDYGNGEKFTASVYKNGNIFCPNNKCKNMENLPYQSNGQWTFSGTGSPVNWDETTYLLDLENNYPEDGITSYGGWSYKSWKILGQKQ